ncbi:sulfite exporter TauE/SafE family protein [Nitratidesulfovibrio sp. SRB-5]|uniref:sulfite exporter TauE/SafE family protein n=1 Tax=Nitratidesulfovibrio sp. SRB-5 TaxID=2872636 RepID=UPI001027A674|nr:sulfite exporter TauE/SafE family protein [Nitratidesulfovibrio sp. SRB-5]MBZ2171424.1 sulfite exporter TauE/SafE family protein [Nitratidesulfovibrio sp. SRB-5]RXF78338.1 sulfite exporter TauE/SafE family protein [Desulfovibrio sp. DS-1]
MTEGLLIAMLGWWLGGFINNIVGFGAALVALPVVALGNDMAVAVPGSALIVLALNVQMAWNYRHHLEGGIGVWPLILGGLPGALVGVLLLRHIPDAGLRLGLGGLLVAYALWGLLCAKPHRRALHGVWGAVAGFFSTSLGTAYGINGPSLAIYLSFRGGTPQQTKAALGVFFIASGTIIVVAQILAGVQSAETVLQFAASLPSVMLGGWAGIALSRRLPDGNLHGALFVMLLVMGANLIRQAMVG